MARGADLKLPIFTLNSEYDSRYDIDQRDYYNIMSQMVTISHACPAFSKYGIAELRPDDLN